MALCSLYNCARAVCFDVLHPINNKKMTDMAKPGGRRPTRHASTANTGQDPGLRVVTVGARPRDPTGPAADQPAVLGIAEITPETLAELNPDVVLSQLVDDGFDCHDVARALVSAGFTGQYRAVVGYVPDPDLVRREVARSCPGLDFDVVMLAAATPAGGGDDGPAQ